MKKILLILTLILPVFQSFSQKTEKIKELNSCAPTVTNATRDNMFSRLAEINRLSANPTIGISTKKLMNVSMCFLF